jgi:hypothetical protein
LAQNQIWPHALLEAEQNETVARWIGYGYKPAILTPSMLSSYGRYDLEVQRNPQCDTMPHVSLIQIVDFVDYFCYHDAAAKVMACRVGTLLLEVAENSGLRRGDDLMIQIVGSIDILLGTARSAVFREDPMPARHWERMGTRQFLDCLHEAFRSLNSPRSRSELRLRNLPTIRLIYDGN